MSVKEEGEMEHKGGRKGGGGKERERGGEMEGNREVT